MKTQTTQRAVGVEWKDRHPHRSRGSTSLSAGGEARRTEGPIAMIDEPTPVPSALTRRTALAGLGAGFGLALAARGLGRTAAQESTPAIASGGEGVTAELMGAGQPAGVPGMELTLRRIVIAPGGGLAPHSHPGALVIDVESGTWGHTALGGTARLTRATTDGTPQPAEDVEIGVEAILTAGDVLFVEDPQDHVRNAGEDDVVLLIAGFNPVGEPFTTFMEGMDMGGTPTT